MTCVLCANANGGPSACFAGKCRAARAVATAEAKEGQGSDLILESTALQLFLSSVGKLTLAWQVKTLF